MSNSKSNSVVNPSKKKKKSSIDEFDLGTYEWENSIMFPLKVMKVYFVIYLIISLIVPIYKGTGFFIDSLSTWISIIMLFLGLLSCYGRFIDFSPMLYLAMSRGAHFLLNFFFFKKELNYISLSLLFVLELGLCILYLIDKSKFECVREREI